jgi:hypothetical protein
MRAFCKLQMHKLRWPIGPKFLAFDPSNGKASFREINFAPPRDLLITLTLAGDNTHYF